MTKVTLNLTKPLYVGTFNGVRVEVDVASLPENILVELLTGGTGGTSRVLRDSVAGMKDDEAGALAKLQKRIDSWKAGSWAIVERGSAIETLMREAIRAEMERQLGKVTDKAFADWCSSAAKAAGVEVAKGKVVPLDAILKGRAILSLGTEATAEAITSRAEELDARFRSAAEAMAAERAKALAAIDTTGLDF